MLACLAACTSSGSLGGVWRGTSAAQGPDNAVLYGPAGAPQAVELVVGEFGPDIAGLMRFYRSPSWVSPRDAGPPDSECACLLLHDGRSNAGQAAFNLAGCLPGGAPQAAVRVRARLTEVGEGLLLDLQVDDKQSPLDGQKTQLTLRRQGLPSDISSADLACPVPPPEGNTASGK